MKSWLEFTPLVDFLFGCASRGHFVIKQVKPCSCFMSCSTNSCFISSVDATASSSIFTDFRSLRCCRADWWAPKRNPTCWCLPLCAKDENDRENCLHKPVLNVFGLFIHVCLVCVIHRDFTSNGRVEVEQEHPADGRYSAAWQDLHLHMVLFCLWKCS